MDVCPLEHHAPAAGSIHAEGKRLWFNITNQCTLRCRFCPKPQGRWTVNGHDLKLEREPNPAELIASVGDAGRHEEAVFSGLGEPTLRLYDMLEAARELRRRGMKISLVTDGLANLIHGRDVTPDFENIVDEVSVSLNAQDESTYTDHCPSPIPGAYESMLDFADRIRYFVPGVAMTAIEGLPGVDLAACRRIADRLGVDFRLRTLDILE